MKRILLIFAVLLYVAVLEGKSLHDVNPEDEDSEYKQHENVVNGHSNNQKRHSRRPRQSFYTHFNSHNPYNRYDDSYGWRNEGRRDYNYRQEELMSRIMQELEELSNYVRKLSAPPPPPVPQYIVIPVPYPAQQCYCLNSTGSVVVGPRIDKNQIWGQENGRREYPEIGDGSRPINLMPVEPEEGTVKPPPVDHGTKQAGPTTANPFSEPGRCKAAILVCCQDTSNEVKKQCFANYGCTKTYSIGTSCHPTIVKQVIEEFAEAYAPINIT